MTASKNQVQDVRGVGGTVVHRQGGGVPQEANNMDPLHGLQSRTYLGLADGK